MRREPVLRPRLHPMQLARACQPPGRSQLTCCPCSPPPPQPVWVDARYVSPEVAEDYEQGLEYAQAEAVVGMRQRGTMRSYLVRSVGGRLGVQGLVGCSRAVLRAPGRCRGHLRLESTPLPGMRLIVPAPTCPPDLNHPAAHPTVPPPAGGGTTTPTPGSPRSTSAPTWWPCGSASRWARLGWVPGLGPGGCVGSMASQPDACWPLLTLPHTRAHTSHRPPSLLTGQE